MIDLIVLASSDAATTRRCLDHLRDARRACAYEIILVGEGPAGTATEARCASLQEAFDLHADRDVVLLCGDCEVAEGWLDRLVAGAQAGPGVATATPFSNGGGLCGYPRLGARRPMPKGFSTAALDALFARENAGCSIEIPFGGAFCCWIARAALKACVRYDGAEAFCARASAAGFRHLLCADVFVRHEVPAPPLAAAEDAAMRTPAVLEFLQRDPARPWRRRVDLARLRASAKPPLLMVTHDWGGGVERHVRDLARLLETDREVLRLRPGPPDFVELAWLAEDEDLEAFIEVAEWDSCVELLRAIGISRIHVHHVHELPRAVLGLAQALGVPYDVTLHDYYPLCPRYHLWPGGAERCRELAGEGCDRCLSLRPAQWGLDLAGWRALFDGFLRAAERVIVPSSEMAARLRRHFPGLAPWVWPHPERARSVRAKMKVALLGGVSAIKGASALEACVADAGARGLPLYFHVIGHVDRPMPSWPEAPLTIGGSYPEDALAELIAVVRPDAFLFLSQVPESYSYTLSPAIATGLPVVATRLGAFSERLRGHPSHAFVEPDADAATINAALLSFAPAAAAMAAPPAEASCLSPESYRQRLLVESDRATPHAHAPPPGRIWFRPEAADKPVGLSDLYDSGVRAGHGESRALLEQRIAAFDADLELARSTLAHTSLRLTEEVARTRADLVQARLVHDGHERELQEALARARARIGEIEGSTFWRLTSPARAVVQRMKRAAGYLRPLSRGRGRLAPRLAMARQIAKDEGVVELVRRVHGKFAAHAGLRWGLRPRPGLAGAIGALEVPAAASPRVSIVIPAYGQDLHTFTCLEAVAAEAAQVPLEVIVMDDASPRPVAEALGHARGVRFERNASNLGFLRNCNRGAALARGEYLLLLNNDAVLGPGALRALLDVFARFPQAGAAGAKLVYPDGRLQEAGGIVWRDGSTWNDGRGGDPELPQHNYLREADYCSAACLLVPRSLFAELGGFDERYSPAYHEDTDLCFRLRASGRRVYYQPAAEVVHFEGASHGFDPTQGPKRHQVHNQARFLERWRSRLDGHRPNGSLPGLERDRGARLRVLLVEACMLTPDQDSGSLRAWRLIETMQAMGCKVSVAAANLERLEPYAGELQQRGVEVLYQPFVPSVDDLIRERGREFDVVILARHYIAARFAEAVRRHAPRALLVFDTIDLHYLRSRRLAQLEGSAALSQAAEAIHRQEIDCIRASDVTWVVSEAERDVLAREVPSARVIVQTNVHDALPPANGFAERAGLLFVGGFRHPPNVDAALYLAREIVPRLARRLPGVTTHVIGSNAPQAVLELAGPGLEVVGFVPDLEPWLARCRVSVSPLRYGAGVKGKVNQAMSRGLPVVATRASVEGMHLVEGEEVVVADDAEAFVEAVARVYEDEALWVRLSRGGLANVDRHFSAAIAAHALEATFALAQRRRAATSAAPAELEAT